MLCMLFVLIFIVFMYYFTCISFAIRPSGRKSAIKLIDPRATVCRNAAIFELKRAFDHILLPSKFHDNLNGLRLTALTNTHTQPHTRKQTLLKTIPPSLRYHCVGGKGVLISEDGIHRWDFDNKFQQFLILFTGLFNWFAVTRWLVRGRTTQQLCQ